MQTLKKERSVLMNKDNCLHDLKQDGCALYDDNVKCTFSGEQKECKHYCYEGQESRKKKSFWGWFIPYVERLPGNMWIPSCCLVIPLEIIIIVGLGRLAFGYGFPWFIVCSLVLLFILWVMFYDAINTIFKCLRLMFLAFRAKHVNTEE
jgi:hypothetical protein